MQTRVLKCYSKNLTYQFPRGYKVPWRDVLTPDSIECLWWVGGVSMSFYTSRQGLPRATQFLKQVSSLLFFISSVARSPIGLTMYHNANPPKVVPYPPFSGFIPTGVLKFTRSFRYGKCNAYCDMVFQENSLPASPLIGKIWFSIRIKSTFFFCTQWVGQYWLESVKVNVLKITWWSIERLILKGQ